MIAHASGRDVLGVRQRAGAAADQLDRPAASWRALIQTRHTAGLSGLPVTPAIGNLILDGPLGSSGAPWTTWSPSTGRGLLLTCLWYIREVDPQTLLLTGLTRDGVYLVENGEVTGAVNNFRFNESPVGMLGRLTEVGATVPALPREWGDYFTRTRDAPGTGRGLQHVLGQPGQLDMRGAATRASGGGPDWPIADLRICGR